MKPHAKQWRPCTLSVFCSVGKRSTLNLQAIALQVRGSNRVVDQDPEGKYEALSRYGRDLTVAARDGKLDPVIGRDDEIR